MKKTNNAARKMGGTELAHCAFTQPAPHNAAVNNPAKQSPATRHGFAGHLLTKTRTNHANYCQFNSG